MLAELETGLCAGMFDAHNVAAQFLAIADAIDPPLPKEVREKA